MAPTKLLIGQVLTVFAIVIGALWSATQWTAAQFAYQPRLGLSWFELGGMPVYLPWRLFEWWYAYEPYAPEVFNRGGMIAAAGGILGVVVAVIGSLWRARQDRAVTTYGSARWAAKREIASAGLFGAAGVLPGRVKGRYLRHDGPEHVMCFAPTPSGKGVGLVIPTLLTWPHSAVVHGIKGENWQLTAGWRSRFSHCLLATIGTFTAGKDGYAGTIRTLTISVKARIVANEAKKSNAAPDFRVYAGRAELGAAWWPAPD